MFVHTDIQVEFPTRLLSVPHNELVLRLGHPIPFLCMLSSYVSVFLLTSQTAEFSEFAQRIPNINRQIDRGEDLFTIWVSLWANDVSGAKTKQYQKHINVYMTNANLSGQLLQQEYFVRFISTSPHAGALEQFKPIANQLKQAL